MQVKLSRSVSKLPFVIALDQGLYKKHGLDVEIRMGPPPFDGGINMPSKSISARIWRRMRAITGMAEVWKPDIFVAGLTPSIVRRMKLTRYPRRVAIAGIDCSERSHIIGNKHINSVEELRGKRIGISNAEYSVTGFSVLIFAQRMGWDPTNDISITLNGNDLETLREGLVDAIVGHEVTYAIAKKQGFPILLDTQEWGVSVAGNSVAVEGDWLEDSTNREAARRFLKATIEGLALFHQNRELVLGVLAKWHGIKDAEIANSIYERGKLLSRKPYPCYEGINNTFELFDSNEMRKYSPTDFYDDSLIRELDDNGFIDSVYE